MNTRHTIPCLAIALSIALFLPPCSSVAAEEPGTLSFLKVGSSYRIRIVGADAPVTVKILEAAGGQWFRVESYGSRPSADAKVSYETWINFANVGSVTALNESDKKESEKTESEKK